MVVTVTLAQPSRGNKKPASGSQMEKNSKKFWGKLLRKLRKTPLRPVNPLCCGVIAANFHFAGCAGKAPDPARLPLGKVCDLYWLWNRCLTHVYF